MLNAVETPDRDWTDSRIDDLKESVDKGFATVDERFDRVDEKFDRFEEMMDAGFAKADAKMDAGFAQANAKMDAGFVWADGKFIHLDEKFDKKFDSLMWGLIGAGTSMTLALLGLIGTLLGTHAF